MSPPTVSMTHVDRVHNSASLVPRGFKCQACWFSSPVSAFAGTLRSGWRSLLRASRAQNDPCRVNASQILTIKKPAHPGDKLPERLALNSLFHTASEERLAFLWLGLTSHGSLLDGAGRLRAHEYHMPKSCQAGSISAQDYLKHATGKSHRISPIEKSSLY